MYAATRRTYVRPHASVGSRGLEAAFVTGPSGDKSSNANLGLFVRRDDGWEWVSDNLECRKVA